MSERGLLHCAKMQDGPVQDKGRELNINRRTCERIFKRWKADDILPRIERDPDRPPIFDDAERARLEAFVTRDARTRRLSWEAIRQEMGYICV